MPTRYSEAELQRRRDLIVEAGTRVFLRYGHARTTMNDVAEEAGISRPALYLVFPRKEDIFAAVIDTMIKQILEECRKAMPKLRSLEKKLHFCFERWSGTGYDMMQEHPDARDVFNLSFAPVRKMYKQLADFIADLLREAVGKSKLKTTPEELASSMIFAMRGLKDIAQDAAHMRRLIDLQVELVLAALK